MCNDSLVILTLVVLLRNHSLQTHPLLMNKSTSRQTNSFITPPPVVLFQLYNEVQARRGGSSVAPGDQRTGGELECSMGHVGNGLFLPAHRGKNHPGGVATPHHYSNGCDYRPNGCSYPISHHSGYGYYHTDGVSEIGDLLQDYLGQDKHMNRKNNGARHVVSNKETGWLHAGRRRGGQLAEPLLSISLHSGQVLSLEIHVSFI